MPQAPTVPGLTPTAVPTARLPNIDLPVPVDAFGGAVGHALVGLGDAVEQGSDRIWQQAMNLQNLQNETEAKNADAQYMMESGKMHADFINKEGLNAGPEALAQHIQDLQDKRNEIRASLSNPRAQQMYDASSLSFMGRNIFNAAGHSGQQMKVAANEAASARIDQAKTNINTNPEDNVMWRRGVRQIQSEVDSQADNLGWSDDKRVATKEAQVSDAAAKRIVGIAKTNAIRAQQMADEAVKQGLLRPNDAERVQATVQTQFRQQGSRYISDKVLGDRREGQEEDTKTEQDYIDEGLKEAEQYKTDDPLFPDFVRQRISADYRRVKSAERDAEWNASQTIQAAIMEPDKDGAYPRTVDELKTRSPEVAVAWDRMRPTQQHAYMRQLAENALGNKVAWNEENMGRYQTLKGMAVADPVKFLNTDVVKENIPFSARRELVNLQSRLTKQSESDPRVMQAMKYLDGIGMLKSAGIDKKSDEESYYNFVGALQDSIAAYQTENKKAPKAEDIQKIGNQLLQQQVTSKGFLWDSKSALYNIPVPDKDEERIKADPYWTATGQQPTTQQIHNYYVREQYNKLFKGSAGTSKESIVPGTVNQPEPR